MQVPDRDRAIIEHILRYCAEIDEAHADFGGSKERLQTKSSYLNAVSMCILQIGELAGKLSEGFVREHAQQPWRNIKGMRNVLAHDYGNLDYDSLWDTLTINIPSLAEFCRSYLGSENKA